VTRFPTFLSRRAVFLLVLTIAAAVVGGAVHRTPLAALGTVPTSAELRSLRGAPEPLDPVRIVPTPAVPTPAPPRPSLLVRVTHALPITSRPGAGRQVGVMPSRSLQVGSPTYAWVISTSPNGRYGLVPLPYSGRTGTGWIALRGLPRSHTWITVVADLSKHQLMVERRGKVILRFRAATGAPATPTPTGKFFVTDRVPFSVGSYYGSFAFGISGVQPRLASRWPRNQLAIHGTNDPGSIGRSMSAGCLRVSERALALLKPLLQLGTPVIIQR
jgi:lipoprotein-anchoring transpeptidase ErfK/SrfK